MKTLLRIALMCSIPLLLPIIILGAGFIYIYMTLGIFWVWTGNVIDFFDREPTDARKDN